jgi:hypothetical protein
MNLEPARIIPWDISEPVPFDPHIVLAFKLNSVCTYLRNVVVLRQVCGRPCLECGVGRTRLQVEHDGARFLPFADNEHAIKIHNYVITLDCDFNVRHAPTACRADVVGCKRVQLWIVNLRTEAVGLEVILAAIVLAA